MSPPLPSLLLLLFFLLLTTPTSTTTTTTPSSSLITLCSQTQYPSLCVHTLSTITLPSTTPADLARATISASLATARSTYSFLSRLPSPVPSSLRDCKGQLSFSVYQLSQTVSELRRLRQQTFRRQMDNAMAWASAAMTNADTCIDGIKQQKKYPADRKATAAAVSRVTGVLRVTSNALFFLNRLAATNGNVI